MDVENISLRSDETSLPPKFAKEGLTFDDVLLVPAESSVLPNAVSTVTRLTRTTVLEVPIVSAAMDTVTESEMAIALAREGGIGIVHRNLSIEAQVGEIDRVKRSEAGMISDPVTLRPGDQFTIPPDTLHWFRAGPDGAVVSEFSTRSRDETDVFSDPRIVR